MDKLKKCMYFNRNNPEKQEQFIYFQISQLMHKENKQLRMTNKNMYYAWVPVKYTETYR